MEEFIIWPLIHNVLNWWLCHLTCLMHDLPLSISPRVTQLFHWLCLSFSSYFAYFLTWWPSPTPISLSFSFIPTRAAVSRPGGKMGYSKPLHLQGNFEAYCPPWSICHHVECQEVSLGLTTGHCSPWHTEREKLETGRGRGRGREEQRENEPDKGPETDLSHSAEPREYAPRLSAPLISQRQPPWQCDTDYWKPWFRLSPLLL